MTQPKTPSEPTADPWLAFGYIVSGVFVYGLIGWGLDRWLGTTFLVAVGIMLGAGFGIYMTYARYNRPGDTDQPSADQDL